VELQNSGGYFVLPDGVTFTGNIKGGSGAKTLNYAGSTSAAIVGNATGGTAANAAVVLHTGSGTLTITGNVIGGSHNGGGSPGIYTTGASSVVVVQGSVSGSIIVGSNSPGISATGASAVVTVTGTVTGGTYSSAQGIVAGGASAVITITGDVNGGAHSAGYGVYVGGASAVVTVTGNVTAAVSPAIYATGVGSSTIDVVGTVSAVTASDLAHAIHASANTGIGFVKVAGNIYDRIDGAAIGTTAIYTRRLKLVATNNVISRLANVTGGAYIEQASLDYACNAPAITDVRSGISYADNQYTGTAAIPPASGVASGVPVDNTVGTAVLSISDITNSMTLFNKWITNQITRTDNHDGTISYTLYDDNDVTPLKTWVCNKATGVRGKAT